MQRGFLILLSLVGLGVSLLFVASFSHLLSIGEKTPLPGQLLVVAAFGGGGLFGPAGKPINAWGERLIVLSFAAPTMGAASWRTLQRRPVVLQRKMSSRPKSPNVSTKPLEPRWIAVYFETQEGTLRRRGSTVSDAPSILSTDSPLMEKIRSRRSSLGGSTPRVGSAGRPGHSSST